MSDFRLLHNEILTLEERAILSVEGCEENLLRAADLGDLRAFLRATALICAAETACEAVSRLRFDFEERAARTAREAVARGVSMSCSELRAYVEQARAEASAAAAYTRRLDELLLAAGATS